KQAHRLAIFSFYETLRLGIGVSSALIVDKDSAVRGKNPNGWKTVSGPSATDVFHTGPGFINERAQYLNANHRDMCKFDSRSDPNYITLRNALSGAVQDLSRGGMFLSFPQISRLGI